MSEEICAKLLTVPDCRDRAGCRTDQYRACYYAGQQTWIFCAYCQRRAHPLLLLTGVRSY